jgi:capsid protein
MKSPTIYDGRGRPVSRYSWNFGEYEAARDDRFRKLHSGQRTTPRPEQEMLPMQDRLAIIAYLRRALRNNPIVAAIAHRYALIVGAPTIKSDGFDTDFNDEKERLLERRLARIMYGTGWSWRRLHKIISIEEMIAGEVFAVDVEDKVQLIPSELCGSPSDAPDGEIDGIGYNEDGSPSYYRFGYRKRNKGSRYTTLTFEEREGAQLIPAEFVSHLGQPLRIEETRFSPRMAPVINYVQHLDDIVKAKVTQVKNQSAISLFMKKNFDPGMFAEAMAGSVESQARDIIEMGTARSDYQDIKNGTIMYGEVGESVDLIEPKMNAQDFSDFALFLLDQICAPLGLFPEEVVVGYRESNYSSARTDRLRLSDTIRDVRAEREAFCDRIVERQIGIAVDSGHLNDSADGIADISYFWPVIKEIDEAKHISAQSEAIATGQKSLDQVQAESGNYPDKVDAQIVSGAVRRAKMLKAYSANPTPTRQEVEAQVVTADEIARFIPLRSVAEFTPQAPTQEQAAATPVAGAVEQSTAKPLIESIGIGGTQALTQIVAQVSTGVIPREQGINTLVLLFGISTEQASGLVPAQGSAELVEDAATIVAPSTP